MNPEKSKLPPDETVIIRQFGGALFVVKGGPSATAKENAVDKMRRVILNNCTH